MMDLIFADSPNMVAYLEKSEDNADFTEIVDFLNASPIRYALTVSPTIYVSYIDQIWSTAKIKTVNNETQIHAKVDGKTIVITESSMRRDLHFNDEDGITCLTDTKIFQNLQLMGTTKRKATEISQSSGPTTLIVDDTIYKERGDSVERAATNATSLDAEAGQWSEKVSIPSYDSPLPGVNTPGSDEERIELKELMDMCTKLFDKVLDLENVKDTQALEIKRLKKRVKKLEKKKTSRTPQLKRRLFKVRIKSSTEKSLGDQEDSSKKGRNEIDQDEGILWLFRTIKVNTASTSITTASINITTAEPVTTASALVTTAGVSVSTAEPSTPLTTTTTPIEDEDLTIAQTLIKMKSEKSKAKGVTMQEPSESGTRVRVPPPQIDPKDKGKAKMIEPEKPKKKRDQIEYDADVAQRLRAELDEEARLEREREKEASKAANIAEWDDVQAIMDADYELAIKLQEQEREELTI
ncbi:hypothetical protein Tco_0026020 [Tanacetum coccineum]